LACRTCPYYIGTVRTLLPEAQLTVIEETTELIDPSAPYDAYALPAERGSALTMLNPRYSVIVPEGGAASHVRRPRARAGAYHCTLTEQTAAFLDTC
jgi:hypothetical protein